VACVCNPSYLGSREQENLEIFTPMHAEAITTAEKRKGNGNKMENFCFIFYILVISFKSNCNTSVSS
jgi:hypothetical protein